MPHVDDIGGPDHSELVIALVAAVGTDIETVGSVVTVELSEYDYETVPMRLSDYLAEESGRTFEDLPFDERLWEAMNAGDELRERWGRGDALALHAISDIFATRSQRGEARDDELPPPLDRVAFLLRSLKTQDELATLRAVYGPRLVVIAAYSPEEERVAHLTAKIEDFRGTKDQATWAHEPEALVERDAKEEGVRGQDVSGTFHQADFFVSGSDREEIRRDLRRVLEILFGSPFRTPTRDEQGQFLAAGAALRSSELGRQVGAAIASPDGSIISIGANEVPLAHGGSHWEEQGEGNRDFEIGDVDTNRHLFEEFADRLSQRVDQRLRELARDSGTEKALAGVLEQLGAVLPADLRAGGLKDLTEFGRAVHAEMNALLDAVRRGVSVRGATLFSTTFPCHNCARHLVGAGIDRVVFIEPYTKSRAERLHADALTIGASERDPNKVAFEPFVGVAPRRYQELFSAAGREQLGHPPRSREGRSVPFDKRTALPVFHDAGLARFRPEAREYRAKELLALEHFQKHRDAQADSRSVRTGRHAALKTKDPEEETDG